MAGRGLASVYYQCPYLGTVRGAKTCGGDAGRGFASIKGWKGHMSRQHKQWSEDQLSAAIGAPAPDAERGRSLFLAEADGVTEIPRQDTTSNLSGEKTARDTHELPASERMKRIPIKSEKLQKFFSTIPQIFLKAKGIEPDKEDMEIIDSATEVLEEMFGIAFEVPEDMWVIRSRWLALAFPLGAIVVVWLKHALPAFLKAQEEKKEEGAKAAAANAD